MPTGQRELAECWGFGAGVWFKYEVAWFRVPICESPSRLSLETLRAVVTRKIAMTIARVLYDWRACDKLIAKWGLRGGRWRLPLGSAGHAGLGFTRLAGN